jgi:hypothetical protein
MKKGMTRANRNTVLFFGIFFIFSLIGIWHALPHIDVIGDESGYVGGVLRAMQAHTIQPHIYDAYTLSFLASYAMMIPVVTIVLALAHFSIAHATAILYAHYSLLYLVPRFVSVLAAMATAYVLLRFARLMGHPPKAAYAAVALILSTVILALVMHTGKMWALSGLLLVLADYFCISACMAPPLGRWYRSSVFWSIGCAFLGVANFPLNAVGLVVVPFLFQRFKDRAMRKRIMLYSLLWAFMSVLLILFNLHGWIFQDQATPIGGSPSFLANVVYQLFLIVVTMPFLFAAVAAQAGTLVNRRLFFLAAGQCALYIVFLSIRAPWAAGRLDMLRYGFFMVLLLGCMLIATSLPRRKLVLILLALSLVFYVQTVRLLAVPTTYNEAGDWIVASLAPQRVEVVNSMLVFNLPKTPEAYGLVRPALCESRCTISKQYGFDSSYRYLVVDGETDLSRLAALKPDVSATYLVTDEATTSPSYTLVRSFGDSATDYFSLDYRAGIYDPRFLLAERFGPPIYLYRLKIP